MVNCRPLLTPRSPDRKLRGSAAQQEPRHRPLTPMTPTQSSLYLNFPLPHVSNFILTSNQSCLPPNKSNCPISPTSSPWRGKLLLLLVAREDWDCTLPRGKSSTLALHIIMHLSIPIPNCIPGTASSKQAAQKSTSPPARNKHATKPSRP